jgi:hypothetical protein
MRPDAYDQERDDRLDFPPDDDRDAEKVRRWFGIEPIEPDVERPVRP